MSGTIQRKPYVWENSSCGVTGRKIPKFKFEISIFGRFLNSIDFFSINFSVKLFKIIHPNCLHNSSKTAYTGKSRFWGFRPKNSQIWVGKMLFLRVIGFVEIALSYNHIWCFSFLVYISRVVWTTFLRKFHAESPCGSKVTGPKVPKMTKNEFFQGISGNFLVGSLRFSEMNTMTVMGSFCRKPCLFKTYGFRVICVPKFVDFVISLVEIIEFEEYLCSSSLPR